MKTPAAAPVSDPQAEQPAPVTEKKRSKRKRRGEDEIDQLFEENLGKKVKKAALEKKTPDDSAEGGKEDSTSSGTGKDHKTDGQRGGLQDILGAIKAAPKRDEGHRSKKKK